MAIEQFELLRQLPSANSLIDEKLTFQEIFECELQPNLRLFMRNGGFLSAKFEHLQLITITSLGLYNNEDVRIFELIESIKKFRLIEASLIGRTEEEERTRRTKLSVPMPSLVFEAERNSLVALSFLLHNQSKKTMTSMINMLSILSAERQLICLKVCWLQSCLVRIRSSANSRKFLFEKYSNANLKEGVIYQLFVWVMSKIRENARMDIPSQLMPRVESQAVSALRLRYIPEIHHVLEGIYTFPSHYLFNNANRLNYDTLQEYQELVNRHPLLAYAIYYAGYTKTKFRHDRNRMSRLTILRRDLKIRGAANPPNGLFPYPLEKYMFEAVCNRGIRSSNRENEPISTFDARCIAATIATLFEGVVPEDLHRVLNISQTIDVMLTVTPPPVAPINSDDDSDCPICMNDKIAACFGCGHSYCLICCLKMSVTGCPIRCAGRTNIIYIITPTE